MDNNDVQGVPISSVDSNSTRKWVFNCKSSEERDTWAGVFQFAIDNLRSGIYDNADEGIYDSYIQDMDRQDNEVEDQEIPKQPEYITVKESMLLMKLRIGNCNNGEEYEACNFTAIQSTSDDDISIHYTEISKVIGKPVDSIHTAENCITSKEPTNPIFP